MMNEPGDIALYNRELYQFKRSWGSNDSQTVYRWEKVPDILSYDLQYCLTVHHPSPLPAKTEPWRSSDGR